MIITLFWNLSWKAFSNDNYLWKAFPYDRYYVLESSWGNSWPEPLEEPLGTFLNDNHLVLDLFLGGGSSGPKDSQAIVILILGVVQEVVPDSCNMYNFSPVRCSNYDLKGFITT